MITTKILRDRLREARNDCGISQHEASARMVMPMNSLSRIEMGNRHVSALELIRFAKVYDKHIMYFVGEENER